ncbi:hypothetical protein D2E98_10475 [Mycobacteroides abscessus]|nr:hypothetical protein A3N97_12640 [Mycobacteroides abscessus]TKV35827.1 hypothetical protein CFA71_00215 [Mycobacteroides abscessus subsp. bolletii]AMU75540.1 hypothetical protein A3O06_13535 [Mycobacteroides abscessus]ANO24481.1 hypothetical protein BAB79_13525 [Mycobacteroides abscessus]PVA58043.1 hypothetical protein DDJ72_03895 [Mycobacteroides abscessus]
MHHGCGQIPGDRRAGYHVLISFAVREEADLGTDEKRAVGAAVSGVCVGPCAERWMEPREFRQRSMFFGEGMRACLAIVLFSGGTSRGLAFEV